MRVRVERFVAPPLSTNVYLVFENPHGPALIIDPAAEVEPLLERVRVLDLEVIWIAVTHGHFDHLAGAQWARQAFHAPLCIGGPDALALGDPARNLSSFLGPPAVVAEPADRELVDGEEVCRLGDVSVKALATPGHTPGSMSYLVGDEFFTGDTLFAGTVGRSDFPGGDGAALTRSLRRIAAEVSSSVRIHPGHGASSELTRELEVNPFLKGFGL